MVRGQHIYKYIYIYIYLYNKLIFKNSNSNLNYNKIILEPITYALRCSHRLRGGYSTLIT